MHPLESIISYLTQITFNPVNTIIRNENSTEKFFCRSRSAPVCAGFVSMTLYALMIRNWFWICTYRYENKQPQLFRNQMSFQNKQSKSEIFKQAYLDANGWDNLSTSICKIPVHQQQCMLLIRNQKTIPACLSWHNLGDLNLLPTSTKAFQQFSAFVFNALLSVHPGSIHAPTNEDAIFNRKRGDCGTNREITYATEWFMFAIFSSSIAQTLLFPRRRRFQKQFASFMLREQTNIGGEKIV